MMFSFAVQKLWSLIRSHLSILAFIVIAFGFLVMKSLPTPMPWIVLPMFSSSVFIVLGFMFKYLIWAGHGGSSLQSQHFGRLRWGQEMETILVNMVKPHLY